jgi:hypothetical protein
MQISLDQLLQVLMARLDSLEMSLEDLKFRTDVALRILRKNNLLDEDKVKEAVKEEFVLLNQLSDEKEEIDEEKIESITKGIINWVDNDVDYFKRQYADFQEKLRQFLEEDKSNISVASPELLKQLESLKGENPKKNKNNFIIP